MAPFDRPHTSSYWRSIVTVALFAIVISQIMRDISRKSRYPPPTFAAPLRDPSQNTVIRFSTEKLDWCGEKSSRI